MRVNKAQAAQPCGSFAGKLRDEDASGVPYEYVANMALAVNQRYNLPCQLMLELAHAAREFLADHRIFADSAFRQVLESVQMARFEIRCGSGDLCISLI